jgi:SHAQKYF class myb-like DNA-binding protein
MVDLTCDEVPSDVFAEDVRVSRPRKAKHTGGKTTPSRYWKADEHQRFLEGLWKYGRETKYTVLIAEHVKTRSPVQVRTHIQKYLARMRKLKTLRCDESLSKESFSSEEYTIVLQDYVENPHPSLGYWELVSDWIVPVPSAGWETQLSHHWAPDE